MTSLQAIQFPAYYLVIADENSPDGNITWYTDRNSNQDWYECSLTELEDTGSWFVCECGSAAQWMN